jgi:hypothetical protein
MVADAFHTGGLIDDVENAIALANGVGGTFGQARATSDAVFFDFHCHGIMLLEKFLTKINLSHYPCQLTNIAYLRDFVMVLSTLLRGGR